MQTRERHHVHGELAEIRIQLAWETQAGRDAGHDEGDELVEIVVSGRLEFERAEADVIEGLVVNAEGLVGVLDKLVHGERCIVRLDNCVGHFWRWHHREGRHHTVGVLFTDLGDEQRTHTSAGTTAERVGDLESLQHVTVFGLFADDVHDRVHELGALGVVALGPVVAGTALAKDKVVRAEQMAQRARADRVHRARLEIDQHGAWHVLVVRRLVVVHIDALQLEGRCAYIVAGAVDAMFIRQHLPELGSDLVTTLAGLQVYDLTHVVLDETKRSVASRAMRLGFFAHACHHQCANAVRVPREPGKYTPPPCRQTRVDRHARVCHVDHGKAV